ncbi:LysR family transcriptional regulator [Nonomuraea rhodomycinica]|uniref:LysR family transcriptional regulator n=1 Tax=Nonomuraea rhodomycinica TaxID=1712872 RepID=A0A7Y6M9B9_9ACTN|nr:LysR family transcriptional regulator [Nonomuraea rhodomycinica]NUW38600.1 LysR family transcriptional regulator [Nonomuraea rhodomycinica]
MDPHLLRTFVAVAEARSFSAAAERLGYTQSAVSQQIAALETDLGLPLLRRRPVEPTEAGTRLLEHAGPLLLRLRAARADVLRTAALPAHRLTLAAAPLALNPVLSARLARGRGEQPRLRVRLRTTDRDQVAAQVAAGEADLGLTDGITAPSDPLRLPDSGPMTRIGVSEEELVVALPPDHPLAGRTGLRLADLVDARWLATPLCPLERLRDLAGDGFRAGLDHQGEDVHTVRNLVAAGHGLTLLPASAGPGVPLVAPRLVHRVELLHPSLPPGPAAHLAAALSPPPS